ncbi:MAG: hypothetical protein ACI88H_000127 [Cocleimonas sp.]|jgi:hypothetical protein
MSYTKADLIAVRQAKVKLSAGERVKKVTVMGGLMEYADCTMAEMTKLENQIIKALRPKRIRQVSLQYDRGI